ncbi:hypothetical protein VNO78_20697 [Psophocarpus tetragonolobus]|uniref:DUF761 domain-containing protein n=1 Tax=Psophocarpus tetragonolobus TaxID=3891 RepID=A0AAN9SAR6_PSOTE
MVDQKAIISHGETNRKNTTCSSQKKGKGSKNIFKVALFMMRGRSRKSKMLPVDEEESKSIWKTLVGSMRPLHLQSTQSPPRHHNNNNNISLQPKIMITSASENSDDAFESASDFTHSPSPSFSRYASAVGLNEMVQEDDNDKEEDFAKEGDEMIDAKAEEFIAQFYHQMRLQRFDAVDRHYQEISMRSLGLS